jgi:hypothetical protein
MSALCAATKRFGAVSTIREEGGRPMTCVRVHANARPNDLIARSAPLTAISKSQA